MKSLVLATLLVTIVPCTLIYAQGFGGYPAAGNSIHSNSRSGRSSTEPAKYDVDQALNYITVEGSAEIRLKPEEIRVVLAVITEAKTADGCQQQVATQIKAVRDAWRELKIPDGKVVEDFISVLPRYEWRLVERDGQQIRLQQREGYRMQSNLHVAVPTEQDAMAAINRAFQHGVTDIVTFDYWSPKLSNGKDDARSAAVSAAKRKAETLLAVFDKKPPVINVQESTQVLLPRSLYETYENVLEEQTQNWNAWRDKPMVKAYRPKMTFLNGVQTHADVRPKEIVMRPEIAVISTVQIYYQSPAEHSRTTDDAR